MGTHPPSPTQPLIDPEPITTALFPRVYDQYGAAAFASNLLVMEGRLQRQGARDLNLLVEKVINPFDGWVEPEIEGRTGTARREVALPWLGEEEEGLVSEQELNNPGFPVQCLLTTC
jgi:hypothetical protein